MKKPIDRTKPPPDIDKHLLFRELIRVPCPRRSLKFRVNGAEHIPLHVRGLKSLQYSLVFEAGQEADLKQVSVSMAMAELISSSVFEPSGKAFGSPNDALMLSANEISTLTVEVISALHVIAPTYRACDLAAWNMALKEGAGHVSNFYESMLMYRSCDRVGMEAAVYERPDRYFGTSMRDLTDGQLMVFSAAVSLIKEASRGTDE